MWTKTVKLLALVSLLFGWQFSQANQQVTPSYSLWNVTSGQLVASHNNDTVRPIASMTKLMSVLVTLRSGLNLDEVLTVTGREGSSRIRPGMRLTRSQLIDLALISSDNLAARTLAETYPGGYNKFIQTMNITASELGMSHTEYSDATGLLATNVSNTYDISKLVLAAREWSVFRPAATATSVIMEATATIRRKLQPVKIVANNTNNFAGKLPIEVAKTGYTSRAGRCLTMLFEHDGQHYVLVIMGASTSQQRTKLVQELIDKI